MSIFDIDCFKLLLLKAVNKPDADVGWTGIQMDEGLIKYVLNPNSTSTAEQYQEGQLKTES